MGKKSRFWPFLTIFEVEKVKTSKNSLEQIYARWKKWTLIFKTPDAVWETLSSFFIKFISVEAIFSFFSYKFNPIFCMGIFEKLA
jgi:hypothetical protein